MSQTLAKVSLLTTLVAFVLMPKLNANTIDLSGSYGGPSAPLDLTWTGSAVIGDTITFDLDLTNSSSNSLDLSTTADSSTLDPGFSLDDTAYLTSSTWFQNLATGQSTGLADLFTLTLCPQTGNSSCTGESLTAGPYSEDYYIFDSTGNPVVAITMDITAQAPVTSGVPESGTLFHIASDMLVLGLLWACRGSARIVAWRRSGCRFLRS